MQWPKRQRSRSKMVSGLDLTPRQAVAGQVGFWSRQVRIDGPSVGDVTKESAGSGRQQAEGAEMNLVGDYSGMRRQVCAIIQVSDAEPP